eukprot:tig00000057_g96.t1
MAAATRPAVSLRALERSRSTLEDFCKSYYMFHGCASPADMLFAHLPLLAFVEGCIYQADEENEDAMQALADRKGALSGAPAAAEPSLALLTASLEERGLLDERLRSELRRGAVYWSLERELCGAWAAEDAAGAAGRGPKRARSSEGALEGGKPAQPPPACGDEEEEDEDDTPAEVYAGLSPARRSALARAIRAVKLKSFDYRAMNLLLCNASGRPPDSAAMEYLATSELLVEIGDDLLDYEDDVVRNSFNVFRAFVRAHGPDAPLRLLSLIRFHERRYAERLAGLPEGVRRLCEARCQEAMHEGGPGRFSGRWTIPPLILDEEAYREEFGGDDSPTRPTPIPT